jgi:hypothetical protein
MKRFDVSKKDGSWKLTAGKEVVKNLGTVKREAVSKLAKIVPKEGGGSVRIHNTDGTIQEERTYPRSADPKRSKG